VDPSPLRRHGPRRRGADRARPSAGGLNVEGLPIGAGDLDELLRVDPDDWLQEIGPIRDFYAALGDSLPVELQSQLAVLERRLREA
jgi:phosphoenolpyruvate carboxykinase (GTP)